uniref:ylmG homolog protein 1-2, chloroplastic n=1 Tax=Erigeron canadensis TaxID=72917 RepID=UPI001CB8D105|nr:ylmG homolog protein 1-2, chloroplastic [Erigeron canadensis]XP_043631853.1 ylmG homolog protein 1-2, chloroplastic [Erigeron canadensis]
MASSCSSSSSSISLMASQTLILQKHTFLKPSSILPFSKPKSLKPLQFSLTKKPITSSLSSTAPATNITTTTPPAEPLLSGSTRTITTLFATALTISKLFTNKLTHLAVQQQQNLFSLSGPLFFATMSGRPARLHTPLTVVAAGMAKWLDIYSGVLLVRVLLSWFPNIPWDRQPLSAIRDLCDPYLNLFRNIIPPVFDTLDVSPLLAFAVLGFLAGILKNSRMGY